MSKRIYVGELARMTGLNTNTIRYYESLGLLPPAKRSESGYREYSPDDAERLRFIQRAKVIGLSLDEVKDIIDHAVGGAAPCNRVAGFVEQKITEVDQRIKDLQSFRESLVDLLKEMKPVGDRPSGAICGYIESLDFERKDVSNGA